MLRITQISAGIINAQNWRNDRVKTYQSTPQYSINYKNRLNKDTVSFKSTGSAFTQSIHNVVKESSERFSPRFNFSAKDIENIVNSVNPKNYPFLKEILNLGNKRLTGGAVVEMLNYAGEKTTDDKELREKLTAFNDLKEILTSRGYKPSILTELLNEIPSRGILDLIKSDILLEIPKNDFNTLQYAYNYAVYYLENILSKSENSSLEFESSKMMKDGTFTNILCLAEIFEKSVMNELFFNRGKYIKTIYMPRFRLLNGDDLNMLRRVQLMATTDKENKGSDYARYNISEDDRIWVLNFLSTNREIINSGHKGLDFENYTRPVNIANPNGNFEIQFQDLKRDLLDRVLRRLGVEDAVVDKYMEDYNKAYAEDQSLSKHRKDFWDINYAHLLNAPKDSLLKHIILADTNGLLDKMIFKEGPIAETNKLNEKDFIEAGLKYDRWIHPKIKPISAEFTDVSGRKTKKFTVKNWDRSAKESLFDGNYTTCCTGIDKDQGESFPHYLTNTCTTTLEVRNEKNKVIAMSRILMAKINGKLSMVVENIEVNNKMAKHYLYNDDTKYKFREMIFDYARNFAKEINNTDEEMPVYFCSKYYKIKDISKGLELGKRYEDVELIGEFPNNIYINAYGGRVDRDKLMYVDDGDGFALYLSNISKKAKPPVNGNIIDVISDSNYNHADTETYDH